MVASVALLSATLALGGCQSAGLGSNHQDIAPRWAGILFGVTNACASIIGIGGIIGTGLHTFTVYFARSFVGFINGSSGMLVDCLAHCPHPTSMVVTTAGPVPAHRPAAGCDALVGRGVWHGGRRVHCRLRRLCRLRLRQAAVRLRESVTWSEEKELGSLGWPVMVPSP